jgi:hypothetical protein
VSRVIYLRDAEKRAPNDGARKPRKKKKSWRNHHHHVPPPPWKASSIPPPFFFPLLNIWQGNYHQREPIYLVYTGRQGCSYISLFLSFSPLIAISLGPYSPPPSHTCCCSTKPQTRNWWRAQPTHTCESLHQQRTQVSYKEKCILYDTYNRFIFIKAHGVITFSPFVFLLCCLNRFVDCALRE